MEKEKIDWIKEYVLAGFVLVCVILIFAIWANTLLDRESDGPSFYRATVQVDTGYYLTRTAEAASGVPLSTKEHKNEHPTSTPTLIPSTATPTFIRTTPTLETDQ